MKKTLLASCIALALLGATTVFGDHTRTSTKFEGPKANKGTVTHVRESGKEVLKLSEDFKVPDTPAPHWQVVDSHGHVYLLNRLVIKGDKYNKSIVLPSHIHNIARVQIWCAWAEALLGEASFEKPIELTSR